VGNLRQHEPVATPRIAADESITAHVTPVAPAPGFPPYPQFQPDLVKRDGRYQLRFARTEEDLDRILRVRYEVFNLELGEGLAESVATGRDYDHFDDHCTHMLVELIDTGEIIGTYRLQLAEMAGAGHGFYSNGEFDLSGLPREVVAQGVELGRACITRPHRNRQVLFLLWKGLVNYTLHNHRRWFFGCCSLTSQDPAEGARVLAWLRSRGYMHPDFVVYPRPGFECVAEEDFGDELPEVKIPTLFGGYLRYGAKISGPPAIDREFKTIDYLAVLDTQSVSPKFLAMFSR